MQTNFYKNKKSLLNLLLVLTIISITLFYSPQKNIISGDTSCNNDELSNVYFPNTSDGDITIITPENKTYTEPDSGYYPGSFGFEDSLPGTIPDGWYTRSSGDGYYEIDHLLEDHYNVYEIRKIGGTSKVETYKILPQSATIGTIEFWLYKDTDSGTDPTRITLRDEPSGGYIPFGIENEDLFIGKWDEKIYTFNSVFSKNEWHHIRVDFDLSVGWQLKLDDTWYGAGHAFTVYASDHPPPSKINTFHVESIYSGDNPNYGAWFDAISYSWDSNYNSGDNLNEGLLLSYDNSTNLDWQGYSLDGQTNKTILGNTTVNMPNDGSHTIQVFGNDSLGTIFSSDIRHFSVDSLIPIISISTPENKTYTEPDSGYYPGSFGFEDGLPGTIPDGWYTRSSGDGYYEIDHLLEDHYNVYEIRKSGGTSKVETYKILPQSATIGTIEFWLYKDTDSGTDPTRITLRDEPTGGYIPFGIENEDLFIGKWDEKIYTFNNVFSKNEWHHIRVDFDLSVGWQLKLDDTWYGAGHAFTVYASDHPPPSKINTFHVESIYSGDNPNYGAWFDAISYSWDSNYNSGDNLNEGLLLSYDNSTNLDWQGYSLDGQTNKTILGNTTVNMPNDGSHTIQVFGNDSLGTIFSSDIRHFSVDSLIPIITINSPNANNYYGSAAPNFDISITELNLNAMWYTINSGLTNVTFTGFTGTIDQTEWDDQVDGQVTIRFYANDTFGHINYAEVLINKDTLDPVITINSPLVGEIFTALPPEFNLTIDEVNLDTTWYTLDGGATTIDFAGLIGYIDSTAWNNAPIGAVTIRFYAKDKAGNEIYQEVIVIKSSGQQEPPEIPGFNIALLCLAVVIITTSLLKIKKYKVK